MSSFMVSNDCMNNIINGLFWNHDFRNYYGGLYDEKRLDTSEDFNYLAEELFTLNRDALMQRYPEGGYIEIPKFSWEDKTVSNLQLLKSLQCLIYQCDEGDIDKEPLFLWLNKVEECLKSFIIAKLPEYEACEWG